MLGLKGVVIVKEGDPRKAGSADADVQKTRTARIRRSDAAVVAGVTAERLLIDAQSRAYRFVSEPVHWLIKVETHNHPSAREPYGGAGTGIGGVIRDPMGTGMGAKPVIYTDIFC